MSATYEKLDGMLDAIRDRIPFKPQVAVVLGSGLGEFTSCLEDRAEIRYESIPGFPRSTVLGHEGKLVFGRLNGKKVVCMQGRVHYYEGYDISDVVMPVRLLRMMGADTLILTNAAGGINREFTPGDLMCISDHISDFVPSPLRGENLDELGVRFPDMSEVYDKGLCLKLMQAAEAVGVDLKTGVYVQLSGPNYETPAEIRMLERLGADAVGMSTAVEAMAARHAGMRVCGVSLITNMASGISETELSHAEVTGVADKASESFQKLLSMFIGML